VAAVDVSLEFNIPQGCCMPPSFFMPPQLEHAIAKELATEGYVPVDIQDLQSRVPALADWMFSEYGDRLVAECIRIQPLAAHKWNDHRLRAADCCSSLANMHPDQFVLTCNYTRRQTSNGTWTYRNKWQSHKTLLRSR
jgi:hypothetical protein